MTTLGTKDIIALAYALADTSSVIADVVANGAPTWKDLPKLIGVVSALKEFGSVDFKSVLPEFESMQPDDVSAVVAAFNGKLNITSATAKAAVEEGFNIIVEAGQAVQAILGLLQRIMPKPALAPAA